MTDLLKTSLNRRTVLQAATVGAVGVSPALRALVHAQGSDAPEKKEVKIGFIPLTDCASVVMASVLGFDKKYGVTIIPTKEASWAGVRDKLVNGELDFAHVLYGLVYGVHLGTAGPKKDMAVLMSLNNNGQAITLSKALAERIEPERAAAYPEMAARMKAAPPAPRPAGASPAPVNPGYGSATVPDPIDVPRAIAEIVALPSGRRPLRRMVHPGPKPQEAINKVSAETQMTLMARGPYAEWARAVLD